MPTPRFEFTPQHLSAAHYQRLQRAYHSLWSAYAASSVLTKLCDVLIEEIHVVQIDVPSRRAFVLDQIRAPDEPRFLSAQ